MLYALDTILTEEENIPSYNSFIILLITIIKEGKLKELCLNLITLVYTYAKTIRNLEHQLEVQDRILENLSKKLK